MTKGEIIDIINKALERRNPCTAWLAGFIADAIVDAQPNRSPIDLQRMVLDRDAEIAEIERLKGTVKEWMEAFATLKEEQRKLSGDLEREKASNLDLKHKLEKARAEYQAKVVEACQLANKLEQARAAAPHFYHPSTMHMGDCSICGDTQDAPQHDVAGWKQRAEKAEKVVAEIKGMLK